jgi:hypothetical protein
MKKLLLILSLISLPLASSINSLNISINGDTPQVSPLPIEGEDYKRHEEKINKDISTKISYILTYTSNFITYDKDFNELESYITSTQTPIIPSLIGKMFLHNLELKNGKIEKLLFCKSPNSYFEDTTLFVTTNENKETFQEKMTYEKACYILGSSKSYNNSIAFEYYEILERDEETGELILGDKKLYHVQNNGAMDYNLITYAMLSRLNDSIDKINEIIVKKDDEINRLKDKIEKLEKEKSLNLVNN